MVSVVVSAIDDESQRNELSEIYQQNINKFYALAFSKLKNKPDAEDAVQEAFLTIAQTPEIFFSIPIHQRVSYISVIVCNQASDIYKRRKKISEIESDYDSYADLLSNDIALDEKIIGDFNCGQMLRFIRELPESLLATAYLKCDLNIKNAEIAKILGVSEDVVRKRISRLYFKINEYRERMRNE